MTRALLLVVMVLIRRVGAVFLRRDVATVLALVAMVAVAISTDDLGLGALAMFLAGNALDGKVSS